MENYDALWQTYAQVYDELLKVIPYCNLLTEVVSWADIQDHMRVLDAGCGTGNLLWALGQQGINCRVIGVDLSDAMLAKAAPKVAKYEGSAQLVRANLDRPHDTWNVEGGFDRVIFNNVLCVLRDPHEALKQTAAVAAEGAVLVASTPRPNPSVHEVLDEHLQEAAGAGQSREEALQRIVSILQPLIECNEALFKSYGENYHLPSRGELQTWFAGTGWDITGVDITYAGQNWLVTAVKKTAA